MFSENINTGQSSADEAAYGVGLEAARVLDRVANLRELAAALPGLSIDAKQMLLDFYEFTEAYRHCAVVYASMQTGA